MERVKLPRDVQQRCIWLVRGYDRCRREYKERRQNIIDGGGGHYSTYKVKVGEKNGKPVFEERRTFTGATHAASRTTEDRELRLEDLEHMRWVLEMHAVEHARDRIGAGMPEMMADYLRAAIMQNCLNGRKYSYERLCVVGISRSGFYRYREAFFYDIANELGLF